MGRELSQRVQSALFREAPSKKNVQPEYKPLLWHLICIIFHHYLPWYPSEYHLRIMFDHSHAIWQNSVWTSTVFRGGFPKVLYTSPRPDTIPYPIPSHLWHHNATSVSDVLLMEIKSACFMVWQGQRVFKKRVGNLCVLSAHPYAFACFPSCLTRAMNTPGLEN